MSVSVGPLRRRPLVLAAPALAVLALIVAWLAWPSSPAETDATSIGGGPVLPFYLEARAEVEAGGPAGAWATQMGLHRNNVTLLRWWWDGDSRTRMEFEYVEPPLDSGAVRSVIDDGHGWRYDDRLGIYQEIDLPAMPGGTPYSGLMLSTMLGPWPVATIDELRESLTQMGQRPGAYAEIAGEEEVAGRRTVVIEYGPTWHSGTGASSAPSGAGGEDEAPVPGMTPGPREESGGVGRVYVDPQTMFILRSEVDAGEGRQSHSVEVTLLDDEHDPDPALFAPDPPSGAREADAGDGACSTSGSVVVSGGSGAGMSAPDGFLRPSYIPDGYSAQGSGSESGPGCAVAGAWTVFRSSSGGAVLLEQRLRVNGIPEAYRAGDAVEIDGVEGYRLSEGSAEVLAWREGDVVAVLTSDAVPFEELLRMAESAAISSGGGPIGASTPAATASP